MDGNQTDAPVSITYNAEVLNDILCIIFISAALNILYVLESDIRDVFLTVPNRDKFWLISVPYSGTN